MGGFLYRHGLEVAERFRREPSPETLPQSAWIPADSEEGRAYREALQVVRRWTKANHAVLHEATLEAARAEAVLARETAGLDVRFWAGAMDASELPSFYKHADAVARQIEGLGRAAIEDHIVPHGCIMAGDHPAPWRTRSKGRR